MTAAVDDLRSRLQSCFGTRLEWPEGSNQLVIVANSAGRTVEVDLGGDVARITMGRIVVALSNDDESDTHHLADVILALDGGHADELFGFGTDQRFGFIGFELRGSDFTYLRLDDEATVTARVPV